MPYDAAANLDVLEHYAKGNRVNNLTSQAAKVAKVVSDFKEVGEQCYKELSDCHRELYTPVPYSLSRNLLVAEKKWESVPRTIKRLQSTAENNRVQELLSKKSKSPEDLEELKYYTEDLITCHDDVRDDFSSFSQATDEIVTQFEQVEFPKNPEQPQDAHRRLLPSRPTFASHSINNYKYPLLAFAIISCALFLICLTVPRSGLGICYCVVSIFFLLALFLLIIFLYLRFKNAVFLFTQGDAEGASNPSDVGPPGIYRSGPSTKFTEREDRFEDARRMFKKLSESREIKEFDALLSKERQVLVEVKSGLFSTL